MREKPFMSSVTIRRIRNTNGVCLMGYFTNRDISAIALSASLWAVFNWLMAPIFWELTHLPILCDMIGICLLTLIAWWTRKPGAASFMGLVATMLNLMLRPSALHFLGFTVASVVFDLATAMIRYERCFDRGWKGYGSLIVVSVASTIVAGLIIGSYFMNPDFLSRMFGGTLFFAALHGGGGIIGGVLGIVFVTGLEKRRIVPQ